jgi:hypothetical protein
MCDDPEYDLIRPEHEGLITNEYFNSCLMVTCLIMQYHGMYLNAVIISYTIHSNSLEKEMTSLYGIRQPAEFTRPATGFHPETLISNTTVLAVRILNIATRFTLRWRRYILPKGS